MSNKPEKKLFIKKSPHDRDFVVLNWTGQPVEHLAPFALAYHCAGRKLAEVYGTTGSYQDFEATPIVFLYRHALELYFKALVLAGTPLLEFRGLESMPITKVFASHRLSDFIPTVCAIFRTVGWNWDLEVDWCRTEADFVGFIREIEEVDPGSFTFRYPTKAGSETGSLPSHFSFNLSEFVERMDSILQSLEGAEIGIKEITQEEFRQAYEARVYEGGSFPDFGPEHMGYPDEFSP